MLYWEDTVDLVKSRSQIGKMTNHLKRNVKNAKQLDLHRTVMITGLPVRHGKKPKKLLLHSGSYWVFIMLQPPTSISYTLALTAQLSGFSSFS